MPELPDVENYARYLKATALHQRIADVHVASEKFLNDISPETLRRRLNGETFTGCRRHGKHLLVSLAGCGWLDSHFGMTGRLRYDKTDSDDRRYDRVRVAFDNGHHLAFVSKRLLGHLGLVEDADRFIEAQGLGPDAAALDRERFHAMLAHKRGKLKSALMDQGFIAGLGNVYSDEILFQARLAPTAETPRLSDDEIDRLFDAMTEVLQTAIDCGAGSEALLERLPARYLLRHREKGARCPRCGETIATRKVAGRTAYLCPFCQRP